MSRDATPKTIYLRDYRPPAYGISEIHLHFDLREKGTRVAATLHVQRSESAPATEPLWLDGEELKLLELRLDGEPLPAERFDLTPTGLRIRDLPERFELQTLVEIAPETNTALEGLYRSSGMFCTPV